MDTITSQRNDLVSFIHENIDEKFDPDVDRLIDIMDSVSFLRLIVFIEQEIGCQLDMSSITTESFEDLDTLLGLINQVAESA